MRTFDLTPLFRSSVGFDHVSKLLDSAMRIDDAAPSYPPYNIEKHSEDSYRITMAVAGFTDADLDVVVQNQSLTIRGQIETNKVKDVATYLHRGIANRSFERSFKLADHIKVGGAKLENGLLSIALVRDVPEALKPRTVSIETVTGSESSPQQQVIESAAA